MGQDFSVAGSGLDMCLLPTVGILAMKDVFIRMGATGATASASHLEITL